jgi:hypothetical protein
LAEWKRRLEHSMEQDRADYAIATPFGRWLVVLRGVFDRVVVRDRVRYTERELARHKSALGRISLAWNDPNVARRMPAFAVGDAKSAREEIEACEAERRAFVAPYGGEPWPAGLRELRSLGRFLRRELRSKLIPRAPAVAGLAVGWWLGHEFSDSWKHGMLARFGFGKSYMPPEKLEMLRTWLPLIAAAFCGYFGAFVSGRVHRRYSTPAAPKRAA